MGHGEGRAAPPRDPRRLARRPRARGAIAIVGFVLGVAWPRLAGVRLAPKRPGDVAAAASPAGRQRRSGRREAPAARAAALRRPLRPRHSADRPRRRVLEPPAAPASAFVLRASVSVQDGGGDAKRGSGGATAREPRPRLQAPSSCPAAAAPTGKVSFVVTADFASRRRPWSSGSRNADGGSCAVLACARSASAGRARRPGARPSRYVVSFMGERKDEKRTAPRRRGRAPGPRRVGVVGRARPAASRSAGRNRGTRRSCATCRAGAPSSGTCRGTRVDVPGEGRVVRSRPATCTGSCTSPPSGADPSERERRVVVVIVVVVRREGAARGGRRRGESVARASSSPVSCTASGSSCGAAPDRGAPAPGRSPTPSANR